MQVIALICDSDVRLNYLLISLLSIFPLFVFLLTLVSSDAYLGDDFDPDDSLIPEDISLLCFLIGSPDPGWS